MKLEGGNGAKGARIRGARRAAVLAIMLASAIGGCSSSSSSKGATTDGGCIPEPGSCDLGAPQMMPLEARGCLGSPVALSGVCATSVNRCDPSAGIGLVCAFAPDGTVYATTGSDNDVLTANGWRFVQSGVPTVSDQEATDEEIDACQRAGCAAFCAGVQGPAIRSPGCPDSGNVDGGTVRD